MQLRLDELKYLFSKELSEIYISMALRRFALSMIGIFIPLFLYIHLNLSLTQVLIFYLVEQIIFLFASPLAAVWGTKIGEKHLMLVSMPFLIVALVILNLLNFFSIPYIIPAILFGIHYGLFWVGMHVEFAVASDHNHRGRQIALWHTVAIGSKIMGPLLGGLLLTFGNFFILLIVSSILLLVSIVPLFFSKEIRVKYEFSWRGIIKKHDLRYGFSYFAESIRGFAVLIIWPILVYLILNQYLSLGIMASLSSLAMAIFTLYMGRLIDKFGNRKIIRFGTLFESVSLFLRQFVQTIFQIFAIDIIGGLALTSVNMPLLAKTYDHGKKGNIVEFVVYRETMLRFGKMFAICFLFFVLFYVSDVTIALKWIFTLSALASLIHFFI